MANDTSPDISSFYRDVEVVATPEAAEATETTGSPDISSFYSAEEAAAEAPLLALPTAEAPVAPPVAGGSPDIDVFMQASAEYDGLLAGGDNPRDDAPYESVL